MDDDHDFPEHTPWTDEGAARLTAAAEALASAVSEHARAIVSAQGEKDIMKVFAASDLLLPIVLAYADAQFDLPGTASPSARSTTSRTTRTTKTRTRETR